MEKLDLKVARGFDPKTQKLIGIWAAQLDFQLKKLKTAVKGLTVKQLEWQQEPGMNSIGMLIAHDILVEVWWACVAAKEIPWDPDGKKIIKKILGFEDDGIPLAPDGKHPAYLKNYTVDKYMAAVARGRRAVLTEMKKWRDKDLDKYYTLVAEGKTIRLTRARTLCHMLGHFCGHYGQILLIKHMMQNAGVLPKKKSE
jgi:hypothetical protein